MLRLSAFCKLALDFACVITSSGHHWLSSFLHGCIFVSTQDLALRADLLDTEGSGMESQICPQGASSCGGEGAGVSNRQAAQMQGGRNGGHGVGGRGS